MNTVLTTNTARKAQLELQIVASTAPDSILNEFVPEILAICEKFGLSGQSGGSAPFTANALSHAIKKLCLQDPIADITGADDEWMVVREDVGQLLYQNKRCSAIFKREKAYYLDAIIWKAENGTTWGGSALSKDGTQYYSRQYVKSFPFKPKTFYIDVIGVEVEKGNWDLHIKNEAQLKKVFRYYDPYTS